MAAADSNNKLTTKDFGKLKVAVIHYWMVTWRGGEKVIKSILDLFPQADIYTLFYDESVCGPHLKGHKVYSSSLDYPFLRKHYQKLFPFYPKGVRSWELKDDYDLIISSESGPTKGIAKPDKTPHLCYIHTPMRYCWGFTDHYLEALPSWARGLAKKEFERLRKWDLTTVENVDYYVANSMNVVNRVKKYYQREAGVCYPPISLDLFENELPKREGKHYLSFGAITPYKNISLLVDTFNESGEPLVVIGDGSERRKLEEKAKENIQFTGTLPWKEIMKLVHQSKALLFPGEEDFGMIPLEVMSQGVPVIALKKGGALETVVENPESPKLSSGIFFDEPTRDQLKDAIQRFESIEDQFDPSWIRSHARNFGEDVFQQTFSEHVLKLMNGNIPC